MKQKTEQKSEYDLQAEAFLKATGTEFKAVFIKNDKHFVDDKETRDIYEITLKRGDREFKFNFGQSINDSGLLLIQKSGERTHHKGFIVTAEQRTAIETRTITKDGKIYANPKRNKFLFDFQQEHFSLSGLTLKFKSPSAYDVLAGLTKSDPNTFKDFCSEYGYDDDSRKAEKIYYAVVNEWNNLKMLYSDEELQQLSEIS